MIPCHSSISQDTVDGKCLKVYCLFCTHCHSSLRPRWSLPNISGYVFGEVLDNSSVLHLSWIGNVFATCVDRYGFMPTSCAGYCS